MVPDGFSPGVSTELYAPAAVVLASVLSLPPVRDRLAAGPLIADPPWSARGTLTSGVPIGAGSLPYRTDDATRSVRLPSHSAARFGPSGSSMILACSLRIASISISGRGGQPGRYMSTGTMWSTPWTIA